ncbi:MAG: hypothetical protein ACLGIA_08850 [Actinomycetes bacterium]
MPNIPDPVADLVPVLSRGKHRSPRKGACFMEMASFLAGERWSDHPSCTHPLLAGLARHVNDCISDDGRSRLGLLIPSVIGLTGDDPHVDVAIARRCARAALPISAAPRQNALAVSVVTCDRVLAQMDGRQGDELDPDTQTVLDQVPHAARWALDFSRRLHISPKGFRRRAAPSIVRCSVEGIATACIPDRDERLYDLLAGSIKDCEALLRPGRAGVQVESRQWAQACQLTTSRR